MQSCQNYAHPQLLMEQPLNQAEPYLGGLEQMAALLRCLLLKESWPDHSQVRHKTGQKELLVKLP